MNDDVPNGDLGKLKVYLFLIKDVWNTFGLPTIILTILLLLWIGTIPSPLAGAVALVESVKVSLDRHLERDSEILFYLKSTCLAQAKIANMPVDTCAWRAD